MFNDLGVILLFMILSILVYTKQRSLDDGFSKQKKQRNEKQKQHF